MLTKGDLPTVPCAKSVLSLVAIQLALTGGHLATHEHRGLPEAGAPALDTNVDGCAVSWDGRRLRLDLPGQGFEPLARRMHGEAVQAPPRRREVVAAATALLGDIRPADAVALAALLDVTDADLRAAVLNATPCYELVVPASDVRALRLDPTDRPDLLFVGNLHVETSDGQRGALRPAVAAAPQWHSRDFELLAARGRSYVVRSRGPDPWVLLEEPGAQGWRGPRRIEVHLLAPRGGRLAVYWDEGDGFAESRKVSLELRPSLVSLGLVHLAFGWSPDTSARP